jgi:hypothetical protein
MKNESKMKYIIPLILVVGIGVWYIDKLNKDKKSLEFQMALSKQLNQ